MKLQLVIDGTPAELSNLVSQIEALEMEGEVDCSAECTEMQESIDALAYQIERAVDVFESVNGVEDSEIERGSTPDPTPIYKPESKAEVSGLVSEDEELIAVPT